MRTFCVGKNLWTQPGWAHILNWVEQIDLLVYYPESRSGSDKMLMLFRCCVMVFPNLYHCIAIPGEFLQIITHRSTVGQMGEFNGIFFSNCFLQSIASLTLSKHKHYYEALTLVMLWQDVKIRKRTLSYFSLKKIWKILLPTTKGILVILGNKVFIPLNSAKSCPR